MNTQIDRQKLKICQFGESCYRKNPIHFREFAHPHLDEIYDKGPDTLTHNYTIPSHLEQETILIQLKLLEKIFPKPQPIKRAIEKKPGDISSSESVADGYRLDYGASTSTNLSNQMRSVDCNGDAPSTSSGSSTGMGGSSLAKKLKITRDIHQYIPVVVDKGQMSEKLRRAAPYNMFLTAITDSKLTHDEPLSVTFQELLDDSLGEIECSVQINFMVDIGWLLGHYYFAGILGTPLLVLYGDETPELRTISSHQPQVTAIKVRMPTPFATSHTKMMLLGYKDGGMRVIISTANLYEDDWHNRTQGIWISPLLPRLPADADTAAGESATNFRNDLMLYLVEYKISQLQPWIARMRGCDFSKINVFFIGSVPGGFREGQRGPPWGHARLGYLLHKYSAKIDDKVPVVCQSSSIGSLGSSEHGWVQADFLNSLRKDSRGAKGFREYPPFKMIYPSFNNVSNSHDGLLGGGCLPYGKQTNDKQPWLKGFMHQWRSKMRCRSHAMPHIKSYTRFNLQDQCVYWFVLTSANLSRAAWGSFNKVVKVSPCLRISNYEAGVLFLPKFVTGEDTFPLAHGRQSVPPFPLPYDVPLKPYGHDDKPFLMDYLH